MPFLKDFVIAARDALRSEDKWIENIARIHDRQGGLLRQQSERFYQAIVWKAAYEKWPCKMEARLANVSYDLGVCDKNGRCTCVIEMKMWLQDGLMAFVNIVF